MAGEIQLISKLIRKDQLESGPVLPLLNANQVEGLPSGASVPPGGTAGQVLTKNSATDSDAGWKTPPSTTPAADSVTEAMLVQQLRDKLAAIATNTTAIEDVRANINLSSAAEFLNPASPVVRFDKRAQYPTVSTGSFAVDVTGRVAGTGVDFVLGSSATMPALSAAVFIVKGAIMAGKEHHLMFYTLRDLRILLSITPLN